MQPLVASREWLDSRYGISLARSAVPRSKRAKYLRDFEWNWSFQPIRRERNRLRGNAPALHRGQPLFLASMRERRCAWRWMVANIRRRDDRTIPYSCRPGSRPVYRLRSGASIEMLAVSSAFRVVGAGQSHFTIDCFDENRPNISEQHTSNCEPLHHRE